jgi:fructose-1,6-bisphosphatase/sedoheptulose 1,7-bisphosphatase-like protein
MSDKIMTNYLSLSIKKLIAQEIVINGAVGAFNAIGLGDKNYADELAVEKISNFLKKQNCGTFKVKTGEGEMDEAPMIAEGEAFSSCLTSNPLKDLTKSLEFEVAIDPLDCTTSCSKGADDAISAVCIGEKNQILQCPDVYMEKLASCNIPTGVISLENSFAENIKKVAKFKNKKIEDVSVIMLDRDRHAKFFEIARQMKIKLFLVKDGDIMSVLKTHFEDIDFYFGIGGAPEGVIAAAVAGGLGGFFEGRFILEENQQIRAKNMGILENKLYKSTDLCGDTAIFAICAITNNAYLKGLQYKKNKHNQKIMKAEVILIDCERKILEKIKIKQILKT